MRTTLGRARGLVVLVLIALSAWWVLVRRRSAPQPYPLAAVPPPPGRLRGEPMAAAGPGPAGRLPGEVLATDAGLTVEPIADGPEIPLLPDDAPTTEIPALVDDLQVVRGIGPSMERMLHGLGITSFRQLATLDGSELDRVRHELRDFRSRIEREDWIGQARSLHRAKYGQDAR